MEFNELNSLFNNIVKQIKLCKCPETVVKHGFSETDKNDRSSNNTCSTCNTTVPVAEKDAVLKMKSVFHKTLQEIGINLNSIPQNELIDDTSFSENSYYIIDCDAKYLKRNTRGETPLHSAAGKKDVKIIVEMLKNNVNPNTQDNAGWTPLHEAVFKDNVAIASELLSAGAIVNVPGYDYTTPLHISVHHNNIEMTRLLLKFGADPKSRDINGRLPEHFAESPKLQSLIKEYAESFNSIENGERFHKKIAPRQMTIYVTSDSLISAEEQRRFENIFHVKFSKNLNKEVTHIVVQHSQNNVCEPTFQVLKSILTGCAIVNVRWLKICLKKNILVNFSDYEINGTKKFPCHNGPRIARNNFLEMKPPLFAGCSIFLRKMNHIQNIKELVISSGAKLLNREPNPEHSPTNNVLFHCKPGHALECTLTLILYETGNQEPELKYNMKHIKSLPVQWFLDCIQTFTIREP